MSEMAKKDVKNLIPFNVKIVDVSLLGINIPLRNESIADGSGFHFNMMIEQRVSIEKNTVMIVLNVKIADSTTNDHIYAEIITACKFEIKEDLNEFKDEKSGAVMLPENGRLLMYSLSISTSRGIIVSELKGTYLQDALLPLIDPQTFI